MSRTIRRVVTAVDESGRPTVFQGEALTSIVGDGEAAGLWPIWGVNGKAVVPTAQPVSEFEPFFPPPGGFRCFVQLIPPGSVPMHQTASVDVILVMEGELWLELADGGGERHLSAGHFLVQTGTRHAWHNRSDRSCLAMGIALGTQPS